ncbi:MAG: adenosylcobinamide-phosphate synthase CbiB, partial [Pseudomonadota bacterium]
IAALDRGLNRADAGERGRRAAGVLTVLVIVGAAAGAAWALARALPDGTTGLLLGALLAWPLIAARSLHEHVAAVAAPLAAGDIMGARGAVAMIVGRDPEQLDQAGIARAAIESLAENASDGVVAPVFWGLVAGLPGIAAYKALNTLDSMIGHRTERHRAFGWAAARLDDLANLIPARLTGALIAALAPRPAAAVSVMLRDARRHRSPNAGWPEAPMAGALGIRLSGPRRYPEGVAEEPWLNAGAPDPGAEAMAAALALYLRAMLVLAGALLILALL